MPSFALSKGFSVQVDSEDADLLTERHYASVNSKTHHVYAKRSLPRGSSRRCAYLHREIAERMAPIPFGYVVDHIDGDTLNCRRSNLRSIPHRQNVWAQHGAGRDSRSGIRGVRQRRGRWAAYICEGARMKTLGTFDTAAEAQTIRLQAEADRLLAAASAPR